MWVGPSGQTVSPKDVQPYHRTHKISQSVSKPLSYQTTEVGTQTLKSHLSSPLLKYFTFIFQVGILKVSAKLKAYSARVLKMAWKNLLFPLKKRVKSKIYFLIREQMCGPPHFLISNQGYKLPTFSGFL